MEKPRGVRLQWCGTCGCRHLGGQHTIIRNCEYCGVAFTPDYRYLKQRFCSRRCSKIRENKPDKPCRGCGVLMVYADAATNRRRAWHRRSYCTHECYVEHRTVSPRASCRTCGKRFTVARTKKHYCSVGCYRQWIQTHGTGPRKNNGGKHALPIAFPRHVKRAVLERANGRCESCLFPAENLELDHTFPVFLGGQGTIENCKALCRDCHTAKSARETRLSFRLRNSSLN